MQPDASRKPPVTHMNLTQEELDALNSSSAEGLFDENKEEDEAEEVEEVAKVEEQVSASTDEDAVADKARVPYSRFETVNACQRPAARCD